jgi:curved DNA-binding protein CbpA
MRINFIAIFIFFILIITLESKETSVNPYQILGVSRTSSPKEIKKSFRKLTLKYHPDRHLGIKNKKKAELMYQKVTEAYEILKDPQKKRTFDMFGEQRMNSYYEEHDNNPFQEFENYFRFQRQGTNFHVKFEGAQALYLLGFFLLNCLGIFGCCFCLCTFFCCSPEEEPKEKKKKTEKKKKD